VKNYFKAQCKDLYFLHVLNEQLYHKPLHK